MQGIVTTPSVTSAFFIDKKLGIFAVFLIGADQGEVHISDDSEASITAECAFKLIAKISGVIIKEFDGFADESVVSEMQMTNVESSSWLTRMVKEGSLTR